MYKFVLIYMHIHLCISIYFYVYSVRTQVCVHVRLDTCIYATYVQIWVDKLRPCCWGSGPGLGFEICRQILPLIYINFAADLRLSRPPESIVAPRFWGLGLPPDPRDSVRVFPPLAKRCLMAHNLPRHKTWTVYTCAY